MTVRTPSHNVSIADKFEIPSRHPIHIPIYSLQNSTRDWFKPKQFIPERWLDNDDTTTASHDNDVTSSVSLPHAAEVKRATKIGIWWDMTIQ